MSQQKQTLMPQQHPTATFPSPTATLPSSLPSTTAVHKVIRDLLTSGLSVGLANTLTNPLDVIKVRLAG